MELSLEDAVLAGPIKTDESAIKFEDTRLWASPLRVLDPKLTA